MLIALTTAMALSLYMPETAALPDSVQLAVETAYTAATDGDSDAIGHYGMVLMANHLDSERVFASAIEAAPRDPRWRYLHALAAQRAGDLPTAIARYRDLLERVPGLGTARHRLADALIESGDLDAAEDVLDGPGAQRAGAANLAALRGRIAYLRGDFATAASELSRALELAPSATRLHYTLGLAYRRIGQVDLAREHLAQMGDAQVGPIDPLSDELLRLDRSTPALRQRGVALLNSDRAVDAIPVLQEALASEPGDAVSMVAMGVALARTGRRDEAMAMLDRCIALNPESETAYYQRATLLTEAGALDAALSSLRQAIALRPNYTEAHYQIAAILMAQGRAAAAATELASLVDRYPDNIFIEVQLAVALLAAGDCQALRVTNRAAPRAPDRPDVMLVHLRAVSMCVRNPAVLRPALATAVRLVQARPSPAGYELIGLLNAADTRDDDARAAFQRGLDMAEDEAYRRMLRQRIADLDAGVTLQALPVGHPLRQLSGGLARTRDAGR